LNGVFSHYIQNCQLPYTTAVAIKATTITIDISKNTAAVISLAKSIGTIGNQAKAIDKPCLKLWLRLGPKQ
jgi:hypothetical protein